jgi:hypothetical protein
MIPSFNQPTGNESVAELADMVAKLQKQVEFLMNGNLSTKNIREVGGWLADDDRFVSADGDVGLSTTDTGGDDVRYWAGGTDPETAPYQIRKSGKGLLTGIRIQSSEAGFPRLVFDSDTSSLVLYYSETKYVTLGLDPSGSPHIEFINGANAATMDMDVQFIIQANTDISLVNDGDVFITSTGNVIFDSLNNIKTNDDFNSLGTRLAQKATAGITLNGGIPIGTVLATAGGGSVTWVGITQQA